MGRCNCSGGSCSCVVTGAGGVSVSGGGSNANPYVVSADFEMGVTDTDTVNLSLSGDGSGSSPYALSAVAMLDLADLVDVDTAGGSTGDVLARQGDGTYALAPPVTAPPGAITVGAGLAGDGSGGDPLRLGSPAWSAYTPVLTASGGTHPTLGNGVIRGRYLQVGKTVHVNVTITWGSTSQRGVGFWSISLPVAAYTDGGLVRHVISAQAATAPNGTSYVGSAITGADGLTMERIRLHNDVAASNFSNVFPAQFAATSSLMLSGTYEAA